MPSDARLRRRPRTALAGLLIAASLLASSLLAGEGTLGWEASWKTAHERAEREMRPILLDFAAPWCAPCRAMDAEFWTRPEVRATADRFVRVRVDFDSETRLRQKFGVDAIPNVVVLDPWQNSLGHLAGWGGNVAKHLVFLRAVPAEFGPIAADARAASSGDAEGGAYERLGELYFAGPLAGASRDFFEQAVRSSELKSDPARRSRAFAKMGWCELKLDDAASARKWFEKSFDSAVPRSDLAVAGLAVAWAKLGKLDRATPLLEELRSAHADSELVPIATRLIEQARGTNREAR